MKVCLDTNVLIAGFVSHGLCADVVRTVLEEHDLVLCEVVVEELKRILSNKLKAPKDKIERFFEAFAEIPIVPRPTVAGPVAIRDEADTWVLASAIVANADILVTGDDDLLSVANQAPIRIISPREFWTANKT